MTDRNNVNTILHHSMYIVCAVFLYVAVGCNAIGHDRAHALSTNNDSGNHDLDDDQLSHVLRLGESFEDTKSRIYLHIQDSYKSLSGAPSSTKRQIPLQHCITAFTEQGILLAVQFNITTHVFYYLVFIDDRLIKIIDPLDSKNWQQNTIVLLKNLEPQYAIEWLQKAPGLSECDFMTITRRKIRSEFERSTQQDPIPFAGAFNLLSGRIAIHKRFRSRWRQFDATKLEIGMNISDVEKLFHSSPVLVDGKRGAFIFGKLEDIEPLSCPLVVILTKDNRVVYVWTERIVGEIPESAYDTILRWHLKL